MPTIVHILGSGAIGGLCAAGATQNGLSCIMHPRQNSVTLVSVQSIRGETILLPKESGDTERLNENHLLIVPLKVAQMKEALKYWRNRVSAQTPVVLLNNGMGSAELARKYLPENPVYLSTTSHGAFKPAGDIVIHTGKGTTMLGSSPYHSTSMSQNTAIAELMDRCIGPVIWRDDIETALWQKLAINCAINPLTALHNIPNGELRKAEFRATIEDVCKEVCKVAKACHIKLSYSATLALIFEVIEHTAENFSSMHQDVFHKRPTEIDSISGYIIKQAKKKGIDVPTNTLLFESIKSL